MSDGESETLENLRDRVYEESGEKVVPGLRPLDDDDDSTEETDPVSSDDEEKKESEKETHKMLSEKIHLGDTYKQNNSFTEFGFIQTTAKMIQDFMLRVGNTEYEEMKCAKAFEQCISPLLSPMVIERLNSHIGPVTIDVQNTHVKFTFKDEKDKGCCLKFFHMDSLIPCDKITNMSISGSPVFLMRFPHGCVPVPMFRAPVNRHLCTLVLEDVLITHLLIEGLSGSMLRHIDISGLMIGDCSTLEHLPELRELKMKIVQLNEKAKLVFSGEGGRGQPKMHNLKIIKIDTAGRMTMEQGGNVIVNPTTLECIRFEHTEHMCLDVLDITCHCFDFPLLASGGFLQIRSLTSISLSLMHPETMPQVYFSSDHDLNISYLVPGKLEQATLRLLNEHKTPVYAKDVYGIKFSANILAGEEDFKQFVALMNAWEVQKLTLNGEAALTLNLFGTKFPLREPPAEMAPTIENMIRAGPYNTPWMNPLEFLQKFATVVVLAVPMHPLVNFDASGWCDPTKASILLTDLSLAEQFTGKLGKKITALPEGVDRGETIRVYMESLRPWSDARRYLEKGTSEPLKILVWVQRTQDVLLPPGSELQTKKSMFRATIAKYQPQIMANQVWPQVSNEGMCGTYLSFFGVQLF